MRRYALRDDQWDRIKDLLPGREGQVGVTARDNRLFVEAVLYRYHRHSLARSAGAVRRLVDLYRTRFPGHKTRLSGLLHDGLVPCGPCVAGALETILLEQPGGVVSGDKVAHGGANLIDGLIDAAMDDLLLEGAEEPLRDTIGLGFTDERVAWAHAPEADLVLEVPGHEGAAMVVAQRDAAGSGGAEMAEDGLDRHADGLGRGVAIAAFADVPAGCLG